jgi:hypothetical protein
MNVLRWFVLCIPLAFAIVGAPPNSANAQLTLLNRSIESGVPWRDTQGNTINAHGAGILRVRDTFYLVGELRDSVKSNHAVASDKTRFTSQFLGVSCYTSRDLLSWTYVGIVVDAKTGNGAFGPGRIGERPKLLYNPNTKRYVLFLHAGTWDYTDHHVAVLSSDQPCGKFRYEGELRFELDDAVAPAGDIGVFQEGEAAYVLSADGFVYKLNEDYTRVITTVDSLDVGCTSCESPAMFKRGDMYYLIYSQKTWWFSNDNEYYVAATPEGPWAYIGPLAPAGTNTHNTQTTFVLPVQGSEDTTYVFMADRWCEACLQHSTYFWQPLLFEADGRIVLPNYETWVLDVAAGTWIALEPTGSSIASTAKSVKATGVWRNVSESMRTSTALSATLTFSFTSSAANTQVRLYGTLAEDSGLAAVSVCGAAGKSCFAEEIIDLYAPMRRANTLAFVSKPIPPGDYTLTVRVTGRKNHMSRATRVAVDRILVQDGARAQSQSQPSTQPVAQPVPSQQHPSAELLSSEAVAIAPACNLLTNSGFETETTPWTLEGDARLAADAQSGKRAMQLGPNTGAVTSARINLASGDAVRVYGTYKTLTRASWVGVGLDFLDAAGIEVSEVVLPLEATNTFRPFGFTTRLPSSAVAAQLWIATTTGSNIVVDDLAVGRAACVQPQ